MSKVLTCFLLQQEHVISDLREHDIHTCSPFAKKCNTNRQVPCCRAISSLSDAFFLGQVRILSGETPILKNMEEGYNSFVKSLMLQKVHVHIL